MPRAAQTEHTKPQHTREETPAETSSQDGDGEEDYGDDVCGTVFRLLSTEEGEPVGDVMKGIQLALQQQGKILYKLLNVVDKYCKSH